MSNFGKERQTGTVPPNVTSTSSRPMSIISSKLISMVRSMLLQFGSSSTPPCCFLLIQNPAKQVKKYAVTQPIFIPQRSFTPLRKANDERSQMSLISSDFDNNCADYDVKTGRDFLNYISLYSQHSPLELIVVPRSQLVQNNALAPLELYLLSGVQPHKSLPAQNIAHSTFEFCCAHVQSEASRTSF